MRETGVFKTKGNDSVPCIYSMCKYRSKEFQAIFFIDTPININICLHIITKNLSLLKIYYLNSIMHDCTSLYYYGNHFFSLLFPKHASTDQKLAQIYFDHISHVCKTYFFFWKIEFQEKNMFFTSICQFKFTLEDNFVSTYLSLIVKILLQDLIV